MAWEVHGRGKCSKDLGDRNEWQTRPCISLSKTTITLNQHTVRMLGNRPVVVLLDYDCHSLRIGFQEAITQSDLANSYVLQIRKSGSKCLMNARLIRRISRAAPKAIGRAYKVVPNKAEGIVEVLLSANNTI